MLITTCLINNDSQLVNSQKDPLAKILNDFFFSKLAKNIQISLLK